MASVRVNEILFKGAYSVEAGKDEMWTEVCRLRNVVLEMQEENRVLTARLQLRQSADSLRKAYEEYLIADRDELQSRLDRVVKDRNAWRYTAQAIIIGWMLTVFFGLVGFAFEGGDYGRLLP